MSNQTLLVTTELPNYNGLNRVPMLIGIPVVPLIFGFMGVLVVTIVLSLLVGKSGFFLAFFFIPFAIFMKILCADDDQAIRIISLELLWFLRTKSRKIWKSNTILARKYGRQSYDYERFFKSIDEATK